MYLADFFSFVTNLKTACTHVGLSGVTSMLTFEVDDEGNLVSIEVVGEGKHGNVKLHFDIEC